MTESPFSLSWPPPFSVRVSARAKYARLRILPGSGLEVVLPRHADPAIATSIVERHRDWVCRTLNRIGGTVSPEDEVKDTPRSIVLHGGSKRIPVFCRAENPDGAENALALPFHRDDYPAVARALQSWVRRYASRELGNNVASLAEKHGMAYSSVTFRRQKSRWGSCTASGSISLNICLVFLPPELAGHVILHELAHTRHMNHGQGFWKTLFAMEPDALKLDKRLRSAWRYVPSWMWD